MSYPLARVGGGIRTHVLEKNGRVLCENRSDWLWLRRDADGGFSDKTLLSPVYALGTSGQPSCSYCQKALTP